MLDQRLCSVYGLRHPVVVYTNTLTCRMEFLTTVPATGWYSIQDGHLYCSLTTTIWRAPNTGQFEIGGAIYPITLITATKLHFIYGGVGAEEQRYYLHR